MNKSFYTIQWFWRYGWVIFYSNSQIQFTDISPYMQIYNSIFAQKIISR